MPLSAVSGAGTYMTNFCENIFTKHRIHSVYQVTACGDLDLLSQKLRITSMNPWGLQVTYTLHL